METPPERIMEGDRGYDEAELEQPATSWF